MALALSLAGRAETPAAPCGLHASDGRAATKAGCIACHAAFVEHTHPVDVDYAVAQARRPADLRTPDEAARRGAALAGGQLRCGTCHDPASAWAHHIALPPGAPVRAAVDPRRFRAGGADRATAAPAPGDEVSPTPLCLACHAYD